jgi:hypothetical protein
MEEFERVTFVTLTYPSEFPQDISVSKRHLREFRRRWEVRWGKVRAIWRLEFQERGAPHYHVMYLDSPFTPIKELCAMWHSVIHAKTESGLSNGVDLKLIVKSREKRLIVTYVSKYIAKVDERVDKNEFTKIGRYWGRWNIKEKAPLVYEIPSRQAFCLVRYAALVGGGNKPYEPSDPTNCTIFGNSLGSGKFGIKMVEFEGILQRSAR